MGKVYKNENQIVLLEMVEIYKPENMDWMQFQITKKNILTLHHIKKVCEGGLATIDNGAILTKKAHRALNIVEAIDYILYDEWNKLFMLMNQAKQPPCDEYVREAKKLKKYTQDLIYR